MADIGYEQFMQWAKARQAEMEATINSLTRQLSAVAAEQQAKTAAEAALAEMKTKRDIFRTQLEESQRRGAAVLESVRRELEKDWETFEAAMMRFFEDMKDRATAQREAFRVRSEAQAAAWKSAIDSFTKDSMGLQDTARKQADAWLEQMKTQANAARENLNTAAKMQSDNWQAFNKALTESRSAFDEAVRKSMDAFKKTS
jgi:hypothetical protein